MYQRMKKTIKHNSGMPFKNKRKCIFSNLVQNNRERMDMSKCYQYTTCDCFVVLSLSFFSTDQVFCSYITFRNNHAHFFPQMRKHYNLSIAELYCLPIGTGCKYCWLSSLNKMKSGKRDKNCFAMFMIM